MVIYKLIMFAYEYTVINFLIKSLQAFAGLPDLWHFSILAQIPPDCAKIAKAS